MAITTKIEDIDVEGKCGKVLTDYQIHTISIVGEGALGINLTKVKSKNAFLETEGGAKFMAKINKAKALDESEAAQEPVVQPEAVVVESEAVEPVEPEVPAEELTEAPVVVAEEGVEPEVVEPEAEPEVPAVEEAEVVEAEAEPEAEPVAAEVEEVVENPEPVLEEQEAATELVVEETGDETNKAKSFTTQELIQSQKDALDGVSALVQKISTSLPDADLWQVSELVRNALWAVEDAKWAAADSLWEDIYAEVHQEVSTRVNKAKALKIEQTGTQEDKLKSALALLDPEMSKLIQAEISTNKAKALEADTQRKATIRAKALEKGAVDYKRIATEDNSTDMITDAMIELETSAPEQHKVIAKALETASLLTMAGNLFPDVGSSAPLQVQTEHSYLESKAKALVDAEGGNLAAARATIRQSEEFITMYGN